MKNTFKLLTITLGLGLGATTANATTCNVYAFGDSLSDIGAVSDYSAFNQSGQQEPPSMAPATDPGTDPVDPPKGFYRDGRYSDGKIWVQYLQESLCPDGTLTSFARGGAYSDDRNANEDIGVLGGLQTQVSQNLDDDSVTFTPNDIVTVWAFSNNVVFELLNVDPVSAVQDVTAAVEALAARGAKTIAVLNAPAVGDTPYGDFLVRFGGAFPGLPNNLNARVTQFNNMLRMALAGLNQQLAARIVHVDINSQFRDILINPGNYGIANATFPCMVQDPSRARTLTGACPVEDGPDGLFLNTTGTVFFDLLHPTTKVHQIISTYASGALAQP